MTKLFNYLRARVFGLAAWTLHAIESVIHPGIEVEEVTGDDKTFLDALILAVVLVVYFAPIAHEIA